MRTCAVLMTGEHHRINKMSKSVCKVLFFYCSIHQGLAVGFKKGFITTKFEEAPRAVSRKGV